MADEYGRDPQYGGVTGPAALAKVVLDGRAGGMPSALPEVPKEGSRKVVGEKLHTPAPEL